MIKPRKQQARFRLIYQDITPAAFVEGLYKNSPSAGLCEDEAGRIFQGRLIDELGLLNKAWNGSTVSVDRKHESFRIRAPRCTISWMVQPSTFQKFMDRKGDEARGIGFLARCLVSYPESTQGRRPISDYDQMPEALEDFNARITELLNDQIDFLTPRDPEDELEKVVLSLNPEAQAEWKRVCDEIETNLLPGGAFCESRDYASKVAENIVRLAANFHVSEGDKGTVISLQTLLSASRIVLWYAEEFMRLFAPPDSQEELLKDIAVADRWFRDHVQKTGWFNQGWIARSFLLQYGPNSLRQRDRLQCVLEAMQAQGALRVVNRPSSNGKGIQVWIQLFPTNYPASSVFYIEGTTPTPVAAQKLGDPFAPELFAGLIGD